MAAVAPALVDAVDATLRRTGVTGLAQHRKVLALAKSQLEARFEKGDDVDDLVKQHSDFVDQFLVALAGCFQLETRDDLALVAVGGYGRGQLHPYSDVDLLVLKDASANDIDGIIAEFVTHLWDVGLRVGNAVRTVRQCVELAQKDVTVATTLMEMRRLCGASPLFEQLREATGPKQLWPSREFFEAKLEEQRNRHARWHDTAHNLEPNIKEGPGGLRNLQIIGWIAKRHFGVDGVAELVERNLLNAAEFKALDDGRQYLFKIRFALHLLAGRNEERLLFDHQRSLAAKFGFTDDEHSLAVEQFMKPFYRTTKELARLNELFLELFEEAIFFDDDTLRIVPIDASFQSTNRFLEVIDEHAFRNDPCKLLELFLVLQQQPEVDGVRASSIRMIRQHRSLVDEALRQNPRAKSLFLRIVSEPGGGKHELRRMHRYGILGRYLPVFGDIEGQMQHDLFHAYTVDEHSLSVVENLAAFGSQAGERDFPLCANIFRRLQKPELLYLAGLFHDIAKGRGGDHSELGAEDALAFCELHDISTYDARIVGWLVKNHLIMSVTAQRQDITDPEVINRFASLVGNQLHLDYLYLLTVADIRATNPTLWNDWKDTLLKDLYEATEYALARGLENPLARADLIEETKVEAFRLLLAGNVTQVTVETIWSTLPDNYFLRTNPEDIAWHTRAIANAQTQPPLVLLRPGLGGTMGFVYTHDQEALFAAIVSILDRLGLTIVEATIITTDDGRTLDSFVIQESDGSIPSGSTRLDEIRDELQHQLADPATAVREIRRRATRALRHFSIPTQIRFHADMTANRTIMEVITVDRPGLLSRISWALVDCDVQLQNAKIATFGERVEDMFYITTRGGEPLDETASEQLRTHLVDVLETTHH